MTTRLQQGLQSKMNRDVLVEQLLGGKIHDVSDRRQEPFEQHGPSLPLRRAAPAGEGKAGAQHARHTPSTESAKPNLYLRSAKQQAAREEWLANKRQQQVHQELSQCTFAPKISASLQKNPSSTVYTRLYKDAEARYRKFSLRGSEEKRSATPPREKSARIQAHGCVDHLPLHKRISKIQKAQREKFVQLQMMYSPKLSTAARSAPSSQPRQTPEGRQRQRQARLQALRDKDMEECTFTPSVSAVSKKLAEASGQDFWQRNVPACEQQPVKPPPPPPQCTFTPDIGNAAQILAATRPELLVEAQSARAERLSLGDAAQLAENKAAVQAAELHRYPFRPQLDAVSDTIAPPSSIASLSQPKQASKQQEAWARAAAAKHAEQCTFTPTLAKKSQQITSSSTGTWRDFSLNAKDVESLSARISQMRDQRAAASKRASGQQAFRELQECTFKPKLSKRVPANTKPVIVHGLGNHLSRLARHRPTGTQDKLRQPPRPSITQPAPFTLSSLEPQN